MIVANLAYFVSSAGMETCSMISSLSNSVLKSPSTIPVIMPFEVADMPKYLRGMFPTSWQTSKILSSRSAYPCGKVLSKE
jgi:hypothetical protein